MSVGPSTLVPSDTEEEEKKSAEEQAGKKKKKKSSVEYLSDEGELFNPSSEGSAVRPSDGWRGRDIGGKSDSRSESATPESSKGEIPLSGAHHHLP